MSGGKTYSGDLIARKLRVVCLVGRFNSFIGDRLLEGAQQTLVSHGMNVDDIDVVMVPGAYEMPLAAKKLAENGNYDAIIALGAVIRGATPHFDYVAGECSSGLSKVGIDFNIPIGFGVLTVDSIEQAIERAGTKAGNKGIDAALAALEMVNLLRILDK